MAKRQSGIRAPSEAFSGSRDTLLLKEITLAVTGASGSICAQRVLQMLDNDARVATINFVISTGGRYVLADELGLKSTRSMKLSSALVGHASGKLVEHSNDDIGASIASGSHRVDAMLIVPCSVGTLGALANGVVDNLIKRAADCMLKERKPLVVAVRETPLHAIHLENMARLAHAGASIFPIMPAFYYHPKTIHDLVDQFCYRLLSHIGLDQPAAFHWKSSH
ncbi:MAG: UbiX family flavin prenyltransferase [Acidobacteriia bacterium]|nr:UbiX family flavin prenyltransferase [Terriglobia bacterium]